jgi:hypothetical protein
MKLFILPVGIACASDFCSLLLIQLGEVWIMKTAGKNLRGSKISFGSVLPANARTRKDEVDKKKVTVKKNAKQRFERKRENNSGLVTAFLRHKKAGYELISRAWRSPIKG